MQPPLKSTKKQAGWTEGSLIFNPMKDLDPKDTYTKTFWNPIKKNLSYRPDTKQSWAHNWFIRKCAKKINTHNGIWQNPQLISRVPLRFLNTPSLKALTEKFTSGMPKMSKSHDRPLCTYLTRYDTHIQSHPRSWPEWYIYWKKLKSDEKNLSYHPDTYSGRTEGWTDGRTWWIQYTPRQLRC